VDVDHRPNHIKIILSILFYFRIYSHLFMNFFRVGFDSNRYNWRSMRKFMGSDPFSYLVCSLICTEYLFGVKSILVMLLVIVQ
jgi:hypothetical protein